MQDPITPAVQNERPKRRSYTKEFKAELVAQCNQGGQSLARIALDNQINANLLQKWQRELNQQKAPAKLLPVRVSSSAEPVAPASSIEIAMGSIIVRFNGLVDPVNAQTVLNLLR